MMSKEQISKLLKLLKSIETKLNILVRLQKASMPRPKITKAEREILKLCDKKHTIEDMMKETKKTKTNVNTLLSMLRTKGYIKSTKSQNRLVYKRI